MTMQKQSKHLENYHTLDSKSFIELISTSDAKHESGKVSPHTQRAVNQVLQAFAERAKPLFGGTPLVSFYSILSISNDLFKRDSKEKLFLMDLLSDCGFLFPEARPVANGVYAPTAQETATRSNTWVTRDHTKYRARSNARIIADWDAPAMISEAKKRLYNEFCHPLENVGADDCPDVLVALNRCAADSLPNWLDRYLVLKFERHRNREQMFADLLKSLHLDLRFYRLDTNGKAIPPDKAIGEPLERRDNGEPAVYTLREVISRLDAICEEIVQDHRAAEESLNGETISAEANVRYREYLKTYQRLENEFSVINSVGLDIPSYVDNWKEEPNGADVGSLEDPPDDNAIRGAIYATIPRDYLPIPEERTDSSEYHVLCKDVEEAFLSFTEVDRKSESLEIHIRNIVDFTLHDAFAFFESDESEMGSFAPVICYLVIRKYKPQILQSAKIHFRLSAIFNGYHMHTTNQEAAMRDFHLYGDLRTSYAKYFGNACTNGVLAIWDHAFLRYSCYLDEPWSLIGSILNHADFLPDDSFFTYRKISVSCESNRFISLARMHSFKKNRWLEHFRPMKPGDPGWESVMYFRRFVKEDQRTLTESNETMLGGYLAIISRPHTDGDIRAYLESCLCPYSDNSRDTAYRQKLFRQLDLFEAFPKIPDNSDDGKSNTYFDGALCAVLEYTLRLILAEECSEKIFEWLKTYIKRIGVEDII